MSTDSSTSHGNTVLANSPASASSTALIKGPIQQPPYPLQQRSGQQQHGGQQQPIPQQFGRPRCQPLFEPSYLIEVVISLLTLVACILVISPGRLPFSWRIGLKWQIVAIGLFLSVMNHCLMARLVPRTLAMLEARRGQSTLQNYNAILTQNYWGHKISFYWRLVAIFFIALPIGLSIGYKQFLGGVSSPIEIVDRRFKHEFGLSFPSLGDYAPMNNSIYLMMNAAAQFMAASSNDSIPFPSSSYSFPAPYGFNLLLLSRESVAALDIPMQEQVQLSQQNMKRNETWTVNATVNAFVGIYNQSIEVLRNDDNFWNKTLNNNQNAGTLHSFSLFDKENEFSALTTLPENGEGADYLLGPYPVSGGQGPDITDVSSIDDERFTSFRRGALMFNIRRQECKGQWKIDRNTVKLISGDCGTSPKYVDSRALRDVQLRPYWLDTLPVLVHSIGAFANSRNQSNWRIPSFAVGAVTAFWARAAFMREYARQVFPDLVYRPQDEYIVSTVETLKPHQWLYVIVTVQPALTLAAFIICACFHKIPIGKGFGLISILAGVDRDGVDRDDVDLLRGAAFSGNLTDPVILNISSIDSSDGANDPVHGQIRYSISNGLRRQAVMDRIQRGIKYG